MSTVGIVEGVGVAQVDAPTTQIVEWVDVDGNAFALMKLRGATGRGMPPIAFSADTVPLQPGTRLRQVRHDARQVVLPVLLEGLTRAEYQAAVRALARVLDPVRGDGLLRATDSTGAVRELTCRYIDGFNWSENYPTWTVPSLLFRADDPYWYDAEQTQVEVIAGEGGSFFPFFPLTLTGSDVFSVGSFVNDGDVETWPVWTISGPAESIVLANLTTGKTLELDATLSGYDSVTIDTRPGAKSVLDQDGQSLFSLLSAGSSLWPLPVGTSNVRFEMAATTSASSVSVRYRRRWLTS